MHISPRFSVIGAGSWGTALAVHLSFSGYMTTLWAHDLRHIAAMKVARENAKYLPSVPFPKDLLLEEELEVAIRHSDIVLLAIPSHVFKTTLTRVQSFLRSGQIILSATKGLTEEGGLMSDLVKEILPDHPYALLSGPSFAKEVAVHLPTTVTIASDDAVCAASLANTFSRNVFRVYTSDDIIGVQIAGAVKNVLAVAVGISDGLGFGANARAALIARGLEEMKRLCLVAGGQLKTVMGLAGVGDLVLTCTDDQSRNRRFGLEIGQGKSPREAQESIGQVVESVTTSQLIQKMIFDYTLDMPIITQVYHVLHHNLSAKDAVKNLFSRTLKAEA